MNANDRFQIGSANSNVQASVLLQRDMPAEHFAPNSIHLWEVEMQSITETCKAVVLRMINSFPYNPLINPNDALRDINNMERDFHKRLRTIKDASMFMTEAKVLKGQLEKQASEYINNLQVRLSANFVSTSIVREKFSPVDINSEPRKAAEKKTSEIIQSKRLRSTIEKMLEQHLYVLRDCMHRQNLKPTMLLLLTQQANIQKEKFLRQITDDFDAQPDAEAKAVQVIKDLQKGLQAHLEEMQRFIAADVLPEAILTQQILERFNEAQSNDHIPVNRWMEKLAPTLKAMKKGGDDTKKNSILAELAISLITVLAPKRLNDLMTRLPLVPARMLQLTLINKKPIKDTLKNPAFTDSVLKTLAQAAAAFLLPYLGSARYSEESQTSLNNGKQSQLRPGHESQVVTSSQQSSTNAVVLPLGGIAKSSTNVATTVPQSAYPDVDADIAELRRANLPNMPIHWAADSAIHISVMSVFLKLHDGSYLVHDRKENCIIRIQADRMAIGGRNAELDKALHEASLKRKGTEGPAYANYVSFRIPAREAINHQQATAKNRDIAAQA